MESLLRPFPTPLTGKQWFYLLFLQGVAAGIIDGGANFGIAYAMYHNQKEIKMWVLAENTIAGDLGVTPIIQCLASMLITSTLVHTDLHHHAVAPLPYVWPHVEHLPDPRILLDKIFARKDVARGKIEDGKGDINYPSSRSEMEGHKGWFYYPRMLVRFTFEGTEANILFSPFKAKLFLLKALLTAAQGALLGIFCGLPLWCLFIVVLGPIYKHDNMAEKGWKWAPMVIKCVYGAVLGWITNPIIAGLALGSQARRHLLVIEHDEESVAENASQIVDADGVPTIVEEDELTAPQFPPSSHASLSHSPRLSPHPSPMSASLHLPTPNINRPRTRSRASSTLSRPPLTANCSDLPIIPSRSLHAPQYSDGEALAVPKSAPLVQAGRMRSPSQVTAQGTGVGAGVGVGTGPTSFGTPPRTAFPVLGAPLTGPRETLAPPSPLPHHTIMTPSGPRRRGLTVSTAYTASSSANGNHFGGGTAPTSTGGAPGTGGSGWSYALGGTGGRNQRPRAISSLSGKGGSSGKEKIPGELWSKSAVPMGASSRTPAVTTTTGEEEEVLAAEDADRPGELREGKKMPVWDVFGAVQKAEREGNAGNKSNEKKERKEQS
ncbi:hypothetical protein AYX14_00357 [Cryptococcus neoformans]|nr:hypothetical protein AYX14_00357 [Cryptococcus neoformans var. grubii]